MLKRGGQKRAHWKRLEDIELVPEVDMLEIKERQDIADRI